MRVLRTSAHLPDTAYTRNRDEERLHDAERAHARALALLHRELARAPLPVALPRLVTSVVPAPLLGASLQVTTATGVTLLHAQQVASEPGALDVWLARSGAIARARGETLSLDTVFADAPAQLVSAHGVDDHGVEVVLAFAESRAAAEPLLTTEVVTELMRTLLPRLSEITSPRAQGPTT
jgi:hypothetical protein